MYKTHCGIFLVLSLAVLGCSPQEEVAAPGDSAETMVIPEFDAEFDAMVVVLGLSAVEQAPLRAAYDARQTRLTEWFEGPEGEKLHAEERALREAVAAKDLAGVRAISKNRPTQRDRFAALIKETEADIRAAIPAGKRVRWDGHRIAEKMLVVMAGLSLTPEQETSIRSNAAAAVEAAVQAREASPIPAGYMQLEGWVEKEILTAPQREAFQTIKNSKPMRTMSF